MDARRLVLRGVDGMEIAHINLSHVDHADVRQAVTVTIETRCDMGHWHEHWSAVIPPWGQRITAGE